MLLTEIIDLETRHSKVSKDYDARKMFRDMMNLRDERMGDPGYGAFARGVQDPKDDSMYFKKMHAPFPVENEGYYKYIEASAPYVKSNPYLPRVYNAYIKNDSLGNQLPTYKMEKLIPFGAISNEEMLSVVQLACPSLAQKISPDDQSQSGEDYNKYDMINELGNMMYREFRSPGSAPKDFNKKLAQVMAIIRKVVQEGANRPGKPMRWDMGREFRFRTDNIMFRRTQTGVQLVISDPVC